MRLGRAGREFCPVCLEPPFIVRVCAPTLPIFTVFMKRCKLRSHVFIEWRLLIRSGLKLMRGSACSRPTITHRQSLCVTIHSADRPPSARYDLPSYRAVEPSGGPTMKAFLPTTLL